MNATINSFDPDYLVRAITEREAADYIGHSVRSLQNWRLRGGGPKFIKISARSIRDTYGDVMEWIDQRRIANTSQSPNT